MKYIELTMIDESVWRIPAEFIAKMRAEYYAGRDTEEEHKKNPMTEGDHRIFWTKIYNQDYEYTLRDNDELLDWLENSCDWSDIVGVIVNVTPAVVDYSKTWFKAEKSVVER